MGSLATEDCPSTPPVPFWATLADRYTWDLDDCAGDNRRWRAKIFARTPPEFGVHLALDYRDRYLEISEREANLALLDWAARLRGFSARLAASDDEIVALAKENAARCRRLRGPASDPRALYEHLAELLSKLGVEAPIVDPRGSSPDRVKPAVTFAGAIERMCDERWWRRKLREAHGRRYEAEAIRLGLVHAHAGRCVSDATLKRCRENQRRNRALLEELVAVNELDERFTLQELVERSTSNPRLRRAELMVRLAGLEACARARGDVGEFYTVTCPSRMHARLQRTGKVNPRYDGTTPREANRYLAKLWAQVRAKLQRLGIKVHGFRVAEPQHDGTPHWHLLLFVPRAAVTEVRETLHDYALRSDRQEPGAAAHRFKAVAIDPAKGTAVGYLAKYISKNIDGFGLERDEDGTDPAQKAARVTAWARNWGIRQFQQIGGPPVGLWRELRRDGAFAGTSLAELQRAADRGDYHSFVDLLGGPCQPRRSWPVRVEHIWRDQRGRYDEPLGYRVYGVADGETTVRTRLHVWRVEFVNACKTSWPRGRDRVTENTVGHHRHPRWARGPPAISPAAPLESCQ